jgi:hypothetical protein
LKTSAFLSPIRLKSLKHSPGELISSHIAMILAAKLRVILQNAKNHPVILHPFVATDHPDMPFARIFSVPLF